MTSLDIIPSFSKYNDNRKRTSRRIGTGLLAIPVLAGSSAYALSDALGWKQGLGKKFKQAKPFYLVIVASTLIGLGINFVNIDPIKALIYTAVINGITAVPILFAVLRIANDKKILRTKPMVLYPTYWDG